MKVYSSTCVVSICIAYEGVHREIQITRVHKQNSLLQYSCINIKCYTTHHPYKEWFLIMIAFLHQDVPVFVFQYVNVDVVADPIVMKMSV